ncbi:MAG: alpha/beta hydrolase, partial [Microcystaceae cyanobacterium]
MILPNFSPSVLFRPLGRSLTTLTLTAFSLFTTSISVQAAERIFFVYNPLKLSLRVESLELFAKEGKVNKDLGFYFNLANVTPEAQTKIRQLLNQKADFKNPYFVPRFFNSSTGEAVLDQLGSLIAIPWDINGKYALRASLIQSTLDPKEGLTLINFLRRYPTDINLNVETILKAANLVNRLGEGTNALVAEMERLSIQEAKSSSQINFAALPDLRQPGPQKVAPEQVWNLVDPKRDRRFRVLVYQPQQLSANTPVVVISHGLASRPEDFRDR